MSLHRLFKISMYLFHDKMLCVSTILYDFFVDFQNVYFNKLIFNLNLRNLIISIRNEE